MDVIPLGEPGSLAASVAALALLAAGFFMGAVDDFAAAVFAAFLTSLRSSEPSSAL